MDNHLHVSALSRESYYDHFCQRFINDIVEKNDRIRGQKGLFAKTVAPDTRTILVVGAGSGETAHFLSGVARNARILAVDISAETLRIAATLFSHPNIEYRKVDITREKIEGRWDVIILPDVYEHIPESERSAFNQSLSRLLSDKGKIILTVPSPAKQESLRLSGGLQIVDEVITIEVLLDLAKTLNADLIYFKLVSVWDTGDYIHAIVERGVALEPYCHKFKGPAKIVDFIANRSHTRKLWRRLKRKLIERKLAVRLNH